MTNKSLVCRPISQPTEILSRLQSGQLLKVKGLLGSAIIICHRHHAELAGPGAAVGSAFDLDCRQIIAIGRISLVYPESRIERQKAYLMRQKWILFTQKAMKSYVPLERANKLLILLYKYFEPQLIEQLPDEILEQLVGVLPETMGRIRGYFDLRREKNLQEANMDNA
ncbi:hypothetical protein [Lyngbya aestuarii]|uniref:hypothetical protein n=1 Tax=Lyngbya aestuarii TaxID=118322 RepID=UPI00403DA408